MSRRMGSQRAPIDTILPAESTLYDSLIRHFQAVVVKLGRLWHAKERVLREKQRLMTWVDISFHRIVIGITRAAP